MGCPWVWRKHMFCIGGPWVVQGSLIGSQCWPIGSMGHPWVWSKNLPWMSTTGLSCAFHGFIVIARGSPMSLSKVAIVIGNTWDSCWYPIGTYEMPQKGAQPYSQNVQKMCIPAHVPEISGPRYHAWCSDFAASTVFALNHSRGQ